MARYGIEKVSAASEPGRVVPLSDASTPIFSDTDLDSAYAYIITNISDTAVTLHLDGGAAPIAAGAGVVLAPGGIWREENYAGALRGRHNGVGGTKDISVVVL